MKKHSTTPLTARHISCVSSENNSRLPYAKDLAFAFILLLTGIFVYYKCRYGFGNIDESFYLVTPLRLCQGDALFTEEWHLSQMSSVLLLPIVKIYLFLTGSTTGIILAMRYVCISVQLLTSVFLYVRLKPYHWLGALLASISFLLYTPFGIMALSYNSMGIIALLVSLTILLTARRHSRIQSVLSGVVFSAAVLCCPFLAVLYIAYFLLILSPVKIKTGSSDSPWSIRRFSFFTVGVFLAAASFLLFVFSRSTLREIFTALPHIFHDPEHPPVSLISKTQGFIRAILNITPSSRIITLSFPVIFTICALDQKRIEHPLLYFIPSVLAVFSLLYEMAALKPYINFVMWPVNLLTPILFLLSKNKNLHRIFHILYLPGMFYAFCLNLSSNQAFYAISSASSVSTAASILILCLFASEHLTIHPVKPLCIASLLCVCLLFVLQFSSQIKLRYQSVFWENSLKEQTQYMDDGIYKGLYISEAKRELYEASAQQMAQLNRFAPAGSNVLFLSQNTWYYLLGDYKMASYSGWLSGINESTISRLESYYHLNPHKLPDIVYVELENEAVAHAFSDLFGYSVHQTEYGFYLTESP